MNLFLGLEKISFIFNGIGPQNLSVNEIDPLLIAEVSANHDKSFDQLSKLIDIAYEAKWNCVKLQTYTADSLCVKTDHPSTKLGKEWGHKTLYDLYSEASMPMEFHQPAFEKIKSLGMLALTSVYDPRDLDFLEKLGCSAYKIASFEMTFFDLLSSVAETGKEIILSTGMATSDEIRRSVDVIKNKNPNCKISLMHCISAYPAPLDAINLKSIKTMQETFNLDVGFSDHTLGSEASILAYALGAKTIEKHVTNNNKRKGPDHRFSAEPKILQEIVEGINRVKTLSGSGKKFTKDIEETNKKLGRRSAFTTQVIEKGEKLSKECFRYVRPGIGIPANSTQTIIGRKLNKRLDKGFPITWEDLE